VVLSWHAILQTLVSGNRCDVATAAKLADPHGTCIVLYRSGPYLSATAVRLGIPLEEPRDTKYCVLLPAPPGASELFEMCEVGGCGWLAVRGNMTRWWPAGHALVISTMMGFILAHPAGVASTAFKIDAVVAVEKVTTGLGGQHAS